MGKKQYQRICLEKNKSDVIENGRLIHSKSLNCTHQHNIGLRVPNDLAWPFWLHSSFPFSDLPSDELLLNISSNDPTFPFSLSRSDELCPAWWAAASSQGSLLLGPKSLPYFATIFSLMITLLLGKLLPSASCLGPFLKTQYSSVSSTGTSRGRGQVFINFEMFSKDSSAFFSFLGQLQADGKVGHETEGVRGGLCRRFIVTTAAPAALLALV